jgi:NifU-like protein involved in Fe-S cluster formation
VYSAQVLDHFEHPRNAGSLEHPTAIAQVENPACGDVLKLTVNLAEGRIAEVRFLAKGCVPAIACGSALTELLVGKTLPEAASVRRDDLLQSLGELPQASGHASNLAIDALAALLNELRKSA